jgi:hypothetical protein
MQTELKFLRSMKKRKMEYTGHILEGSIGLAHLQILEGHVEGKRKVGRPNRTWMDILKRTGLESYGEVKKAAEEQQRWKLMLSTFVNKDCR